MHFSGFPDRIWNLLFPRWKEGNKILGRNNREALFFLEFAYYEGDGNQPKVLFSTSYKSSRGGGTLNLVIFP